MQHSKYNFIVTDHGLYKGQCHVFVRFINIGFQMSTLLLVNTFKMTKAKAKAVILSENPKNNFEHLKDTDKCRI